MYDFLDRPVTSLDHGGRFLIWSMRMWVKARGEKQCPAQAIGTAFAKWNMIAGLQPFLRIMAMFNHYGLETFRFCQLHCNHISEHEAIIVSLVCSLQDSRPETVVETATLLVEEEFVSDLIASLSALGRSMDQATIFPERACRSS